MGSNGVLGNSFVEDQPRLVAVNSGQTFAAVSGSYHTCGVTVEGNAFCWGEGSSGELGNSSRDTKSTPVTVSGGIEFSSVSSGSNHTCGVTTQGELHCWGYGRFGQLGNGTDDFYYQESEPAPVSPPFTFRAVSTSMAGFALVTHTCGVTTPGEIYCRGDGSTGQLGNGSTGAGYQEPRNPAEKPCCDEMRRRLTSGLGQV